MPTRALTVVFWLAACSSSGPTASDLRDLSSGEPLRFPDGLAAREGTRLHDRGPGDAPQPLAQQPFGINMPNLLHAYLGQAPIDAAAARKQLDRARASGFTHLRFIASGFWPTDMSSGKGWQADPTAYFQAFDALVADVKARGMKLVPSLLWNLYLFPDLAGEPAGKLFVPGSKTRLLAEKYITEVVSRYAASGAVLFWELGNEANLLADLDVATCNVCAGSSNSCGGLAPSLGTPCKRTVADNIYSCNSCRGAAGTQQDLGQFTGAIAKLVATLDPAHPFSSGNAYPRPSAWHLAHSPCPACDWTADSADELAKVLAQLHPPGVAIVSVHHYPGPEAARFGSIDEMGIDLLKKTQGLVKAMGKQLYVGEHGEPRAGEVTCGSKTESCGGDPTRVATRRLLDALVSEGVAYSALWAYEFYQFCADAPTCYTVKSDDEIVLAFASHNQAVGACAALQEGTPCPIGKCASGRCRPVPLESFRFELDGDETSWTSWTNCTGCTPGETKRIIGIAGASHLRLTSFGLTCGSGCSYPGVYAASPAMAVTPGQIMVRAGARSSHAGSNLRLIALGSAGQELAQAAAPVPKDVAYHRVATWMKLPASATEVRVRLEVTTASATLDADDIEVDWQP